MKLVGLKVCLFNLFKTKALECLSVINQKCMPRPKILDVNEGVGETLFYPYNVLVKNVVEAVIRSMTLWRNCAFLISLRE